MTRTTMSGSRQCAGRDLHEHQKWSSSWRSKDALDGTVYPLWPVVLEAAGGHFQRHLTGTTRARIAEVTMRVAHCRCSVSLLSSARQRTTDIEPQH